MTESAHYAWMSTTALPGQALSVEGGRISLDGTKWPHVEATIKHPDAALLGAVDPRVEARRVVLSCGEDIGGIHRQFDLAIRGATATPDGLQIDLASDETLVEDAAPADDVRPWAYLRNNGYTAGALARLVLDQIGATVADPTPNPDITPYWSLTNRVVNPRFQTTIKGAASGTGTSGFASATHVATGSTARRALQFTCATGGGEAVVAGWDPVANAGTALPVKAGEPVSVSVDVSCVAPGRGKSLKIAFVSGDGTRHYETLIAGTTVPNTRWVTITTVQRPVEDGYVTIRVVGDAIASGADQRMFVTNVCVVQWDDTVTAFNGGDIAPTGYTTIWDGTADDSTSTRIPIIERDPDSLVQKAGGGGMSFLAPVLQSVGLRLVCDETRTWSLRTLDHAEPGTITITDQQNMNDYTLGANLEDWCDAATVHYSWERYEWKFERDDTFELVTPPRKRRRVELNMPYPGAGRAENIVRRAQQGGSQSAATAVSNWAAKTGQAITITTPETIVTGAVGAVTFDLDTDTMTITIRTEETP